ncbi:Pex24p-domain-containing protein [Microthyrium microscopicum]|uniref:Pex24p-domain-containing protein n=1 Tax=Microthyrium microscopicum TaxID=703497 RepID=A0A6A6U3J8_9PEZI|nr:Pex24p-domain-containing protein [Microthyrium microscopicum]
MSSPPKKSHRRDGSYATDHDPPAVATFSPPSASHSPEVTGTQRATILVQQKSPLLVATPPEITRVLAYSHPFIIPLNKLVGLLSWTTGDPWESFLLVAAFWATCLYGDIITRFAGPLFVVMTLILAMYIRRFSHLSSTGWMGEKKSHKRGPSEANLSRHKSLEDIVETLRLFTSRCNILLDPFLRMTDFLSTQTSATAATTRPALTALFIRIVLVTPVWIVLSLHFVGVITTKRVILAVGTTVLTWHSQPARVTRALFWRNKLCRQVSSVLTGLNLMDPIPGRPRGGSKSKNPHDIAAALAAKSGRDARIHLTFTLYENQRRWLGIGWTSSMLAYERSSWTDEHLNSTATKERFTLPEVEGGHAKWQWVTGSSWHVLDTEGDVVADPDGPTSDGGWMFYDNKWQNGRKGRDGWGKYTRRRRWARDAELVEVTPEKQESTSTPPSPLPSRKQDDASETTTLVDRPADDTQSIDTRSIDNRSIDTAVTSAKEDMLDAGSHSVRRKKGWFSRKNSQPTSEKGSAISGLSGRSANSCRSYDDDDDDVHMPLSIKEVDNHSSWGVGDDAQMNLS